MSSIIGRRAFAVLLLTVFAGMAFAKSGPTYYTPERLAAARENLARYEWARKVRTRIFETGDQIRYYIGPTYTSADKFAAQSDDFIWLLQPTTKIPRVAPRNRRALCPVHGKKVKGYNAWCPYNIDPINHPYQIQCMMGKEWYPSNKYHQGDMTSGEFPDDGSGILHKGERYYALREYAHMVYGSIVVPTLSSLSQGYQLTGDPKYARKGCILLARLATQYPNYGWAGDTSLGLSAQPHLENRFDRTYLGPWNNQHPDIRGAHGGMITDMIWETFMLEATAYAYDGLYDYMDKDPSLIAFLKQKGMPIDNGKELREYIETYILRAGMRGLLLKEIEGNEGHHQASAMAVALVMDDYGEIRPNSGDMVEYTWHGHGNAANVMTNALHRDGGGHESPNYGKIKLDFIRAARLMERIREFRPGKFPEEKYPDIFASPKARAIFDYYIDIFVLDTFIPSIGDCGGIRAPYRRLKRDWSLLSHENLYAVQRWGDPRHARACTTPDGELVSGELWEPYPEKKIRELLKQPESQIVRASRLLDGYGVAILESGAYPRAHAAVLSYAGLTGHQQNDKLALGLFARGVEYLPDLGYPKTWNYRSQYDSNVMAHNTVAVDETETAYGAYGIGRLFASADGVHVIAASHDPYPPHFRLGRKDAQPVDVYERTVLMVDADGDRFYVVDYFAVRGGEQHDQSWHAMMVKPEAPKLDWRVQEQGTLAGPEVKRFATKWTDRWGRQRNDFPAYVAGVRRAELTAPAVWRWKTGLPEGDALALHVLPLGGPAEVIMGRGRSPVRDELDYLLVRRVVKDGGASRFLTVLDAYQGAPVVCAVTLRSESPLVLEITRDGETDEITLHLPVGPTRTPAHRPLGVRVVTRRDGEVIRRVQFGQVEADMPGYVQSTVAAVKYQDKAMAVQYRPGFEDAFVHGRTLRIYNDLHSGLYRIEQVRREGDLLWLTLDHSALFARAKVVYPWLRELELNARVIMADRAPGTWVLEGDDALKVSCASRNGMVMTQEKCTVEILREYYKKVVSLWEYGVGDQVEIARRLVE